MPSKRPETVLPVTMTLFPTLGSIQEVIDLAESKIPLSNRNEMYALLMTMQNTLLKVINEKY